jgi:hypothetical protein
VADFSARAVAGVPVPLLPPDPDVPLDLQRVMTNMYDVFGYDLDLNYTQPPQIPLEGDDAAWARQLLDRARVQPQR